MFNFIISVILTLATWYLCLVLFFFVKRKADFYSNKVVHLSNLWAYSFQVLLHQLNVLFNITNILFNKLLEYYSNEKLQQRKSEALKNVVNHFNQNLIDELGIKTTQPVTTRGVNVWVFLANKLDSATQTKLENYFSGVLSKYTQEFALDILVIEQIAGAGWVAKFDVKPVAEAQYNRMARASEVVHEEKFDEEIDIW
ncbi:TPA: hypothetical protein ACGPAJ_000610 [Streptococcus suis]